MTEENQAGETNQHKQDVSPSTRMLRAMCEYATRIFESDAPTEAQVNLALDAASVACGQLRTRTRRG